MIESIVTVMGSQDDFVCRYHLPMDKWKKEIISLKKIFLGIGINTRTLMVSMDQEYIDQCLHLVNLSWHPSRPGFTANQAQKLVGKLDRLGQAAP